jgi:cyclomaltodextrinase
LKDYLGWWNLRSLPKFNTTNPEVRRYLMGVSRYWIEQGADGWRLDVPNEIDDDSFWKEFHRVVRTVNPQAYLLGEIWEPSLRWVGNNHFDGLMNYPLREAILDLLTGETLLSRFARRVEELLDYYPAETLYAMYNSLGTHDTERVFTVLGSDIDKVKVAFLFLFAYPGVPAVYYGDEIGLSGGKDPDCRRTFPWDEMRWKKDIRNWVKALIQARKESAVLRGGDFRTLMIDDEQQIFVFERALADERVLCMMHTGSEPVQLSIPLNGLHWPEGKEVRSLLSEDNFSIHQGRIEVALPPMRGMLLG